MTLLDYLRNSVLVPLMGPLLRMMKKALASMGLSYAEPKGMTEFAKSIQWKLDGLV